MQPLSPESPSQWTHADSIQLYGVQKWGAGYFDISEDGLAEVCIEKADGTLKVPIMDIVDGMKARGMEMPTVLRIRNVLDDRIRALNEAFREAIEQYGYRNQYMGVFPIKVNQQCHVVEEIAVFGQNYRHGLEAGSKAELIIALASKRHPESLIICNGYKDSEFIDLGLFAREMGYPCIFVLETQKELELVLERSDALNIEPILGIRIRSNIAVEGYWSKDSGEQSIFGLSTVALMDVVKTLRSADKLHCLQLLHCHLGSQIPNIRDIRNGVEEACRYYAGLIQEGAAMGYLDLGGGLAVDYEGSRSTSAYSMNYQLTEYCVNIVETICETLDATGISHPVIVTESGRATVSYSSMLLFNILHVRGHLPGELPASLPKGSHKLIQNLWEVHEGFDAARYQEYYNDTIFYSDKIRDLFRRGEVSLSERALGDNLRLALLEKLSQCVNADESPPPEMLSLPAQLADVYYGNFSLFQSLPDIWAINHVFPVMPIHRLNEEPGQNAVLADLTCDSDGRIDRFILNDEIQSTLKLHSLEEDKDYHLAVFLVGAYQETLGDLHNLFGDTNVVSVYIKDDGSIDYEREFEGDCIGDVLQYVEYDPKHMAEQFRKQAEEAVRLGKISANRRKRMMKAFAESLNGYTYFEKEDLS